MSDCCESSAATAGDEAEADALFFTACSFCFTMPSFPPLLRLASDVFAVGEDARAFATVALTFVTGAGGCLEGS